MSGKEFELCDLEADRGETRNLIDERPEVAGPLQVALRDWFAEVGPAASLARGPVEVEAMDPKEVEALRALGYLGSGPEEEQGEPGEEP